MVTQIKQAFAIKVLVTNIQNYKFQCFTVHFSIQ